MKKKSLNVSKYLILMLVFFVNFTVSAEDPKEESKYIETVSQWNSYEDVAKWMEDNYTFDHDRSKYVMQRIKKLVKQYGKKEAWKQPGMLQSPEETFVRKKGFCKDAANFAKDAINRINPELAASFIFIKNRMGPPHHWVTGFTMDGKIYVMDFGAGPKWRAMNGVHGPYNNLNEYLDFLSSLNIRFFEPILVKWAG